MSILLLLETVTSWFGLTSDWAPDPIICARTIPTAITTADAATKVTITIAPLNVILLQPLLFAVSRNSHYSRYIRSSYNDCIGYWPCADCTNGASQLTSDWAPYPKDLDHKSVASDCDPTRLQASMSNDNSPMRPHAWFYAIVQAVPSATRRDKRIDSSPRVFAFKMKRSGNSHASKSVHSQGIAHGTQVVYRMAFALSCDYPVGSFLILEGRTLSTPSSLIYPLYMPHVLEIISEYPALR